MIFIVGFLLNTVFKSFVEKHSVLYSILNTTNMVQYILSTTTRGRSSAAGRPVTYDSWGP
jgi:hypothetical protein